MFLIPRLVGRACKWYLMEVKYRIMFFPSSIGSVFFFHVQFIELIQFKNKAWFMFVKHEGFITWYILLCFNNYLSLWKMCQHCLITKSGINVKIHLCARVKGKI